MRIASSIARRRGLPVTAAPYFFYPVLCKNHECYQGDNGRVIGYDNAHGYHHRHYFGHVEPVDFVSFEDIEDQFARDWTALRSKS